MKRTPITVLLLLFSCLTSATSPFVATSLTPELISKLGFTLDIRIKNNYTNLKFVAPPRIDGVWLYHGYKICRKPGSCTDVVMTSGKSSGGELYTKFNQHEEDIWLVIYYKHYIPQKTTPQTNRFFVIPSIIEYENTYCTATHIDLRGQEKLSNPCAVPLKK